MMQLSLRMCSSEAFRSSLRAGFLRSRVSGLELGRERPSGSPRGRQLGARMWAEKAEGLKQGPLRAGVTSYIACDSDTAVKPRTWFTAEDHPQGSSFHPKAAFK